MADQFWGGRSGTFTDPHGYQWTILRASQINGCSACVDSGTCYARQGGESDERLFAVAAWRDSPYFTAAERAALALAEAVTRLSDRTDPVPDEIWDEAARHYDEPALAALVLSIAVTMLKARVKAGRLVVDEPTDLPEGTEVELLPLESWRLAHRGRPRCSAPSSEGLGRRRQGRSARRRGRYPSRTSVALKNRRIRFTATAQEHVRREKAWWLANRDHTDVFTGRSSRRFQVPEPSTLSLPFPAFAASTSGESPPISITRSMIPE